jgi:signal peptidase I
MSVFAARIAKAENNHPDSIRNFGRFTLTEIACILGAFMANEPLRTSRFHTVLVNVFYIALAIGLAALIQTFVIRPFIVSGNSMDPNIENKDYLIIDKISYRLREPARGEVITFKSPPEPTKYYIKRIIGLPGETVKGVNGVVTIINKDHPEGFTLDEPYITHKNRDSFSFTVPADSYFVMGDNRSESFDSRGWGALPKKNISGRALVRLLPLSHIDYLPAVETYNE